MSERPEDRSDNKSDDRSDDRAGETRRTGPLGEDRESEETREVSHSEEDEGATRRIPAEDSGESRSRRRFRRDSRGSEEGDGGARVIRTPGSERTGGAPGRPRGYYEAVEEREERLRELYGGVDWVASFLGFVFAVVTGVVLAGVAGLVLTALGFSLPLSFEELGTARVTGLVVVAVVIFLTYLFGGYVAGRLARFDGGRNGVMTLLWTIVIALLLLLVASVLPDGLSGVAEIFRNFVDDRALPIYETLRDSGLVGAVIAAVALLVAVLGGLAGGRSGSRYHREIDYTT